MTLSDNIDVIRVCTHTKDHILYYTHIISYFTICIQVSMMCTHVLRNSNYQRSYTKSAIRRKGQLLLVALLRRIARPAFLLRGVCRPVLVLAVARRGGRGLGRCLGRCLGA